MAGERYYREYAAHPEDVAERIYDNGFTVVDTSHPEFNFEPDFAGHMLKTYFNGGALQPETYENVFPPTRERARDVLHVAARMSDLLIEPHTTTAIEDRSGFNGVREYPRIDLAGDEEFCIWLGRTLCLLPLPATYEGTVGVNLFRTRKEVVSGPHQDGERLIIVYVLDRRGEGAVSELYEPGASTPFFRRLIKPHQMLIFDDTRFKHNATSLEGEGAVRDAIVCTVNKPETYPFQPMEGLNPMDARWALLSHGGAIEITLPDDKLQKRKHP